KTGSIDLTVSGGAAPYTYKWYKGASTTPFAYTQDVYNLGAGTYKVVIKDCKGCSITKYYTINQPAKLLLTIKKTDVKCYGDKTGSIDLTVSGGTAPYTYVWKNAQGVTVSTAQDPSGLPAGTYTVWVTDCRGCKATCSVTINQPAKLLLTIKKTDVKCYGDKTGSIDLTVSGGTPPYTYVWKNAQGVTVSTAQDPSGLAAGTYSVWVTDCRGCKATCSVTINQPAKILLTIKKTDVKCYGDKTGSIDLTVSGGTPPYTYVWKNAQGVTVSTAQDPSGLAAGTYTVWVTDYNGCKATCSVTIEQPAKLMLSIKKTDIKCYGEKTGSIDLTVSGGTAPYTYEWKNAQGVVIATTQDVSGLGAGTYTVVVTDCRGCKATCSVTIEEPAKLLLTIKKTDVKCYGDKTGSIDLTVSGGTPPYTYEWKNAQGVVVSTAQDPSGLPAGTYTVVVTDYNGCKATCSVTIEQPYDLDITGHVYDVKCYGEKTGSINITVTGGTAPYTYSWKDEGGNEVATTEDLQNAGAGKYTVTVTDKNGCKQEKSFEIKQPYDLEITGHVYDVKCYGDETGSINITVSGGTEPYTYSWKDEAGNVVSTNEDLQNVGAGEYTVTVTDKNGCEEKKSFEIKQPAYKLALVCGTSTDASAPGAKDGSLSVTASGGTGPYAYALTGNGENRPFQASNAFDNLAAGEYKITVKDDNDCEAIVYCEVKAKPAPPCKGFRTQTQGGWGSKPSGNNPGTYLHANFDNAFPNDLVVGCNGGYTLKLTSAQAVTNYLPGGGTPDKLSGNLIDPAGYGNNLAAQLVALTLSVGFDKYDADFGASGVLLENLVITQGIFEGWTVKELLVEANLALGGCDRKTNATFSQIADALDAINNCYVDGTDQPCGYLKCPPQPCGQCETNTATARTAVKAEADIVGGLQIQASPNPFSEKATIQFSVTQTTEATVDVYSITGAKIGTLFKGKAEAGQVYKVEFKGVDARGQGLKAGTYIYQLATPSSAKHGRLIFLNR
ncbi:MAG: SprB repeat-containing protein, partial [Cytophagales bacterium]|nr:SprB repeat-containing protein [Cytophagales bacterium]